ncbi:hypothetical protein GCM10009000_079790 [Halobacterium noricense]|uniref:Uncharacterized protein n=1 Tax=Haladaptatus pallidirubidus TaxID=1008152 RepID=A0AAV3UC56_9EURY
MGDARKITVAIVGSRLGDESKGRVDDAVYAVNPVREKTVLPANPLE